MFTYKVASLVTESRYQEFALASALITPNAGLEIKQVMVEKISHCQTADELKTELNREKTSLICYVANSADEIVEVATELTLTTLPAYKQTHLGISKNYNTDYMNFGDTSLVCSIPSNTNEKLVKGLNQIYKGNSVFSNAQVLLTNLYFRVYQSSARTGILNFTKDYVSLTVTSNHRVISSATLKITNTDIIETTVKLIRLALSQIQKEDSKFCFDVLLLAGECEESFLNDLKILGTDTKVEMFDALRSNLFILDSLSAEDKNIIETQSYRFAITLGALLMSLEYTGVDLSEKLSLSKFFLHDLYFYTPQTLIGKVVDYAKAGATKAQAAAMSQSKVIAVVLLIASIYFGYSYYSFSTEASSLTSKIAQEKKIFESLKDVRQKVQDYELKLKTKNDRIKSIENIQLNQNLVPTILYRLEEAQSPVYNVMIIDSLKVQGKTVSLTAESIDKPQTLQFLKSLANAGTFLDVNPIYDSSDIVKCKYSLTTEYNGPVSTHQIKLPISTPEVIPVSNIKTK